MIWEYIKATVMIILIIAASYYVTKFVASKSAAPRGNADIRVRNSVSLGRDRRLVITEIGDKVYILGVTAQHIEIIDIMERDEFEQAEEQASDPPAIDFKQEFMERLRTTFWNQDKK